MTGNLVPMDEGLVHDNFEDFDLVDSPTTDLLPTSHLLVHVKVYNTKASSEFGYKVNYD